MLFTKPTNDFRNIHINVFIQVQFSERAIPTIFLIVSTGVQNVRWGKEFKDFAERKTLLDL